MKVSHEHEHPVFQIKLMLEEHTLKKWNQNLEQLGIDGSVKMTAWMMPITFASTSPEEVKKSQARVEACLQAMSNCSEYYDMLFLLLQRSEDKVQTYGWSIL